MDGPKCTQEPNHHLYWWSFERTWEFQTETSQTTSCSSVAWEGGMEMILPNLGQLFLRVLGLGKPKPLQS